MENALHPPRYFRIAPTPSGYLHEGNAFNFILTAARAGAAGGSLRLRIDDLDAPRVRPEYVHDVFETLHWLGIHPDAGPGNAEDHHARFSQALRRPGYDALLQQLVTTGLVFACTCSRAEILAQSPSGRYPGTCRSKGIPLGTPDAAWRVATPEASWVTIDDPRLGSIQVDVFRETPHFLVRRRDGLPAYHVASLHDDLLYRITDIIRGEDLLPSTAAQRYLSQLLGGTPFDAVRFEHHPLLQDAQGEKQSKSAGAASLRATRERGAHPGDVYRRFGVWMGWGDATASLDDAVARLRQA